MATSQKQEDRELVERSQRGDQAAFGVLVARYQGLIYGFITTQIRDFSEAEDLTQNTFIRAYRKIGQLREPDAFRGWLRAIASAECKTWQATRGPLVVALETLDGTTLHDQQAMYQWQEQQNRLDNRPEVLDALDKLTDDHREVVNLHYIGELSCREIADNLGLSVPAVEKRLSRARKHLRAAMPDELDARFDKHRLPGEFTERVLRRLSLCPVMEGGIAAKIEGDVGTLVIGVDSGHTSTSFIFVSMERADTEAVWFGRHCTSPASVSRIRFADTTLSVLASLGIRIKEIRLGLDSQSHCSATAVLVQNGSQSEAHMRANDALCLAGYGRVSLYAEDALVGAQRVAVPGVERMPEFESPNLEQHLLACGQLDLLVRTAFANGLSPESGVDTIVCRVNRAADTITLEIPCQESSPVILSLPEYSAGIAYALGQQDPDYSDCYRHDDGRWFRVYYSCSAEGAVLTFRHEALGAEGDSAT